MFSPCRPRLHMITLWTMTQPTSRSHCSRSSLVPRSRETPALSRKPPRAEQSWRLPAVGGRHKTWNTSQRPEFTVSFPGGKSDLWPLERNSSRKAEKLSLNSLVMKWNELYSLACEYSAFTYFSFIVHFPPCTDDLCSNTRIHEFNVFVWMIKESELCVFIIMHQWTWTQRFVFKYQKKMCLVLSLCFSHPAVFLARCDDSGAFCQTFLAPDAMKWSHTCLQPSACFYWKDFSASLQNTKVWCRYMFSKVSAYDPPPAYWHPCTNRQERGLDQVWDGGLTLLQQQSPGWVQLLS